MTLAPKEGTMFGRIGAGSWQTVTRAGLAVLTGLYLLGLVTYREAVASSQPLARYRLAWLLNPMPGPVHI